jgi:hypothetical protein
MGTGANILFDLEIANTLFVSKNGNDATGERGNWDQPFATLFGASASAVAGDCVFVFAGTYDEVNNDWVKSDVRYYFNPSTLVIGDISCITDGGIAKNIIIEGFGKFHQLLTTSFEGALRMTNIGSTVYFRGQELFGYKVGAGIYEGTFDIKVDFIHGVDLYAFTCRGNSQGTLEFDRMESLSGDAVISLRNLGTDLAVRTLEIKGRYIKGDSTNFSTGVITHINTNNTRVIYSDFEIDHIAGVSGGLYSTTTNGGAILMRNIIGISLAGYGISGNGGGSVQLTGCNFDTVKETAVGSVDDIYARNCWFKQTSNVVSTSGAFNVTGSAEVDLQNCTVELESTAPTRKCINVRNNNIRLSYCKIIATALQNESIGVSTLTPQDIIVEGQCSTNRPVSNDLTNIVAGTNIIVDSNIGKNTNNFL